MTELNLLQETEGQLNKPKSKLGLVAFGLVAGCTVGLCVVTAPFLSPALRKVGVLSAYKRSSIIQQ